MVLLRSYVLAGLAALVTAKSAVLDLTPSNFDEVVLQSGKATLVEFFAPWCGHCKKLAPVYEELAHAFEYASDKVQIAKVDADAEKSLGKRFDVKGYPTLKWFDGKSETPEDYKRPRDLETLIKFIAEKTDVKPKEAPSKVQMLHDYNFKENVGKDKHVFVAFTAPWCGHCKTLAPVWEEVAQVFDSDEDVVIAKVDCVAGDSKEVASQQDVSSYPTIKWFPKGSSEGEIYEGDREEEIFIKFINSHAGTHRVPGGALDDIAGTIEVLNDIVAKYATEGISKLSTHAAEAKKAAENLAVEAEAKYAQYYVRVFDKLSQNEAFVEKELARLEGMMKKGGLALPKRDEIKAKINVLKKFAQKAADDIKEDVADAKDEL